MHLLEELLIVLKVSHQFTGQVLSLTQLRKQTLAQIMCVVFKPCVQFLTRLHLVRSLEESAPLHLGDHAADELSIKVHLVHLHLCRLPMEMMST